MTLKAYHGSWNRLAIIEPSSNCSGVNLKRSAVSEHRVSCSGIALGVGEPGEPEPRYTLECYPVVIFLAARLFP